MTPGGNVRGVPGGPAVEPDGTVGNPVGNVTRVVNPGGVPVGWLGCVTIVGRAMGRGYCDTSCCCFFSLELGCWW